MARAALRPVEYDDRLSLVEHLDELRTRLILCIVAFVVAFGLASCDKDTVELGGQCTDNGQCKDPSDTCMLVAGKSRCTMACSKDKRCPNGYVCPVTDPANKQAGSCLLASEIGPNVVTVY
jgi:Sec-independent protein secretion pathway component TatC